MAKPASAAPSSGGGMISPREMGTALPETRTSAITPPATRTLRPMRLSRPISTPCVRCQRVSPSGRAPEARSCAARMAEADPVAGSSGIPAVGENMRARNLANPSSV